MAVIALKPTSPGQRFTVKVVTPGLHKGKPHKALTKKKNSSGGRNNLGRVTVNHKGGGHKRRVRLVDFKRDKAGIPAVVERIEYDPNRTAHIALVLYKDGERRYILAPKGLKAGMPVESGPESSIAVGNCLPLNNIPLGTVVHCVEEKAGKGAQIARSAGAQVVLLAKEQGLATLRLSSGEVKKVSADCCATIGVVSNDEHNLKVYGKAGAKRWLGIRPTVRGVAMNPVDHPLGGGEGKTSGGRPPCNRNGLPEGKKTRNRKKASSRMIVRRRNHGKTS